MAYYRYSVVSFDGNTAIAEDATDYRCYFDSDDGNPLGSYQLSPIVAEVVAQHAAFIRTQPQAKTFPMTVELKDSDHAKLNTLKKVFAPGRSTEKYLRVTDGTGLTLRLAVSVLEIVRLDKMTFQVIMHAARPVFENDTENDATHTLDSAAETITAAHVQNDGNDDVRPRFTYTPATTGGTYKPATAAQSKQRHVVVASRAPLPMIDANGNPWPIDITGGGWDLETKVKAGEVHPQGYDLDVFVNGVKVNRWLSNAPIGYGFGNTSGANSIRTYEATPGVSHHAQRVWVPGCTSAETVTIDEVGMFLIKVGTPTGTFRYRIRADSNGVPGAVVTNGDTDTITASGVGTGSHVYTAGTWSGTKPVLNAQTWYWLQLDPSSMTAHDASNYIRAAETPNASTAGDIGGYEGMLLDAIKHSVDQTTWLSAYSVGGVHGASSYTKSIAFRMYPTGNATKIWITPELPALVKLTLAGAILDAANQDVRVSDVEGTARLPDGRFAAVVDTECLICEKTAGTTDEFTILKRAARGTANASHAVGASVYLVDIDVRVVFNRNPGSDSTAAAVLGKGRYEPPALAPAINGVLSTNSQFRVIGPHFGFGSEVRPVLARAEQDDSVSNFDQVSLDSNNANDLVNITFKDAKPGGDYISCNTATFVFPTGIESGSNKITLDATPIPAALSLEHYLTNERGEEELVATHRNPDAATGKTISPASVGYRYRLLARNEAVTGCETNDTADATLASVVDNVQGGGQSFYLEEETTITGFAMRLKDNASGTNTFTIKILGWDNNDTAGGGAAGDFPDGVPASTKVMAQSASMTQATTTNAYATYTTTLSTPVVLAAGWYWIGVVTSAFATPAQISSSSATAAYGGGETWTFATPVGDTAYVWTKAGSTDLWFRIYGTPTQGNTPKATGGTLDIDNFIIELDDTTPGTPFVGFQSSDQDCWLVDNVPLTNSTTGQTVNVTAIMQAAETLDIDFEPFTVTHSDDDLADQSYLVALSGFDEADPFKLAPGANVVTWNEAGLTGSITSSLRSRYREGFL